MRNDLRHHFNQLERETITFLRVVERFSEAQRGFQPTAQAWNALQVIAHLVTVERGLLEIPPERRGPLTWKSKLIHWGMVRGLMLPIRLGVPVKGANPSDAPPLEELRERWEVTRARLRERLEAHEDSRQPFARHPMTGAMTARQTLAFYRAHLYHHRYQLARIRRSPGFPSH